MTQDELWQERVEMFNELLATIEKYKCENQYF